MAPGAFEITPMPGVYVVAELDAARRVRVVSKDKTCSCGGNAERPCRHIGAVKDYLESGGERAPEPSERIARPPRRPRRSRFTPDPVFERDAAERLQAYWDRVRMTPQERRAFLERSALKTPYPYVATDRVDRLLIAVSAWLIESISEILRGECA
jgi:hypothetical protein